MFYSDVTNATALAHNLQDVHVLCVLMDHVFDAHVYRVWGLW